MATRTPTLPTLPTGGMSAMLSPRPVVSRSLTELPPMDPRLQRAIALQLGGARRSASVSTASDEIAVIARVNDVEAFQALSEVRDPEVIGAPDESGDSIVTARVAIKRLERVHEQPFVHSLKAAQRVHAQLDRTVPETQSAPELLKTLGSRATGGGVVVGVVDFGCDVAHLNLRKRSGGTRLLSLWDQGHPGAPGGGVAYGKAHGTKAINAALAQPDPYAVLQYPVEPNEHGTHVIDIAAGNGLGSDVPGMAPKAELVFVQLGASDVAWGGADVVRTSFGDSVQLLEAVKYIFRQAGHKPCVVNLSLGTNGGPHDGSTLVERGLDALVRETPGRAVVIAAANARDDGIHTRVALEPGASATLPLLTRPGSDDEVEFWYGTDSRELLQLQLVAPDGTVAATVGAGESLAFDAAPGEPPIGLVVSRRSDPNNGQHVVNLWMSRLMPKGAWQVVLTNTGPVPSEVHGYIERNDRLQANFGDAAEPAGTLGSISCGLDSIVVGSYDAHKDATPISWFSAEGPTRDGRHKPEVSAPGHGVRAAASTTLTGTTVMSGTSMAAPAVTGLVALMLDDAHRHGFRPPVQSLRDALAAGARSMVPAGGWDPRYGAGRISALGAITSLRAIAGAVPPSATAAPVAPRTRRATVRG